MVSYIAEAERFWRKSKHENRIRTADTRKRRSNSVLLQELSAAAGSVSADEARNDWGTPKHIRHRAVAEAGQALVAGQVRDHGHSSPLHDTDWNQINMLKSTEVHQEQLLVESLYPGPLAPVGHKVPLKS